MLTLENIFIVLGIWLALCAVTAVFVTAIFRITPQDHSE